MIEFTVYGTPIPKGSTRAFMPKGGRFPVVTHDNPKTRDWQNVVVDAARQAHRGEPPMDGPVCVAVKFYMPRPKSAPSRVTKPTKRPDLDKLVRCVKDGLTRAGIFRDDSQVTRIVAEKLFADPGTPRAEVSVWAE